jgi:hypothetical protein
MALAALNAVMRAVALGPGAAWARAREGAHRVAAPLHGARRVHAGCHGAAVALLSRAASPVVPGAPAWARARGLAARVARLSAAAPPRRAAAALLPRAWAAPVDASLGALPMGAWASWARALGTAASAPVRVRVCVRGGVEGGPRAPRGRPTCGRATCGCRARGRRVRSGGPRFISRVGCEHARSPAWPGRILVRRARARVCVCARAQGGEAVAGAPTLVVFVKLGDNDHFATVRVSSDAFVGDLTKLVKEELKLDAPPNRVTLTKEGEETPLDSTLTVQEALGGVARPRLIVKAPKVERAPGAWLAGLAWPRAARRTCVRACARARPQSCLQRRPVSG